MHRKKAVAPRMLKSVGPLQLISYSLIAAQPANGYNSDELDEPEEAPKPKKRKLTKAAEAKLKAKAKAKKAMDDEDEDDYEDAYTALVKDSYKSTRPPIGSFEDCAKCKQQLTVVCHIQRCPSDVALTLFPDQIYYGCGTSSRILMLQMRKILWSRPLQEACCSKEA
jgi:hypothetical protein